MVAEVKAAGKATKIRPGHVVGIFEEAGGDKDSGCKPKFLQDGSGVGGEIGVGVVESKQD